MAEIKRREQLSPWLEYELETDLLAPPVLRLRLRPYDPLAEVDAIAAATPQRPGQYIRKTATAAVVEWDVTENGQPIALSDEMRAGDWWNALLAEPVVRRAHRQEEGQVEPAELTVLATAIWEDARDRKLFLKN